ncbi:MAG: PAS domain S-box protein [Rhodoferax sp.]|uniref:PAS domain S-box protein n=1 Tax=Rhodoferax sp. TaxID=50421 RepID=UPI0026265F83|nr:PAS domain S-box protein [Rhodoferax sp.]MDD2881836.1 PAS domain S-box protein [Rhodoferax sp.]
MTNPARRRADHPDGGLMEANALLRMVIDENPNIILMKDWDGKFLLGNRALAGLYGTTPDGLVGKDDGAFNPNAEQVAFYLQNVRDVMAGGKTQVVMEASTNAATGETQYYQSIKIPLTTPEGKKQILVIANDVSELKRTQQKLEESERRLRYVLDATGEGVWDWDIATGIVTHNRRWCQIAGLDDAYLQHPLPVFAALLHPDDKPQVMEKLQACLAGKPRYQSEHRMRLKDGQVVWVLDRGDVVERDAQGAALRMVGSFVDISERKAAELAAERSSNLLHEAVNSIDQGFSIFDAQDRLYLCNDAFLNFYETSCDLIVPGATFEEIVRQGAERGQYKDAMPDVDAWVRQRVAKHQSANGELIEQQLADGRWLLVVEYRTPSGFIVGNRLDITELKATAQALSQRELHLREHVEQLNAIFDLSPDGFVTFDSAKRVKYVSPAFTDLTGLPMHEVMGVDEANFSNKLALLCLPQARFPGLAALRANLLVGVAAPALVGETASSRPNHAQRQVIELADASKRVLELGLRESAAEGVSQILYLRDITHEIEVDRLKSEFLSTAAHELRTPMASIYGFAEVLLKQKVNAAERMEFLNIIFSQSELMSSILNELLDLARIEARQGKDFVIETTPVQRLVADVVGSFKWPAGRTAPALAAPESPLFIAADRKKAMQAVLNVLSNAYKYSSLQGQVSILIEPRAAMVAIQISDQGIGMTSGQVCRVGERFYRADTSGKVSGTGLGMSIVNEILALHQGSVAVESVLGRGTTVTLLFPMVFK